MTKYYTYDPVTFLYTGEVEVASGDPTPANATPIAVPSNPQTPNFVPLLKEELKWSPTKNEWLSPSLVFFAKTAGGMYSGYGFWYIGGQMPTPPAGSTMVPLQVPPASNWRDPIAQTQWKYDANEGWWVQVIAPGSLEAEQALRNDLLDTLGLRERKGWSVAEQLGFMNLELAAHEYESSAAASPALSALAINLDLTLAATVSYVQARNAGNPFAADLQLAAKYRKQIADATDVSQLPSLAEINLLVS